MDVDGYSREHPQVAVLLQAYGANAQIVGMFGGYFYDLLNELCRSQFALGVALRGQQMVMVREQHTLFGRCFGHDSGVSDSRMAR